MTVRIRRSTGNVFSDLGFGEDEAENLKIRADLMIELTRLIGICLPGLSREQAVIGRWPGTVKNGAEERE